MNTKQKKARVFKLTPAANSAIESVATTTTRNLSNSVCYLIGLGYEQHLKSVTADPKKLTQEI